MTSAGYPIEALLRFYTALPYVQPANVGERQPKLLVMMVLKLLKHYESM